MKFKPTVAIVLSLCAVGVSAQSFDTNCTRNYYGDVSCKSRPADGEGSYIDLLGFQRGAELANSQNQNDMLRQQSLLMQQQMQQQMLQQQQQQQYLEQLRILRCQQAPLETRLVMGCN